MKRSYSNDQAKANEGQKKDRSSITAFKCSIVHSIAFGELEILEQALVGVDDNNGKIVFVRDLSKQVGGVSEDACDYTTLVEYEDRLLIPGFIDGHIHAPQYAFIGIGMHLPLLQWLETYTFPKERQFEDIEFAKKIYRQVVKRTLQHGTTTCSYFATIHLEATQALADIVEEYGQRGYVGKVNMDQHSPDNLIETTEQSVEDTRKFVDYCLAKQSPLITPVITPRFVPSTTGALMNELASISREHEPFLPIQSHLAENTSEIKWVKQLFPKVSTYTGVYDKHQLLHDRTYMAHCIWCSSSERRLLHERKTGVIHCPNSNFHLGSGVLNVRQLINEGIKVGLGTDVAGGCSVSMLDAIRQAVVASKLTSMGFFSSSDPANSSPPLKSVPTPLTYAEAFHLATVGGADCLGLSDTVGNFLVGKEFDALVINVNADAAPLDIEGSGSVLSQFQRFLFLGDDRHIESVYVRGQQVDIR